MVKRQVHNNEHPKPALKANPRLSVISMHPIPKPSLATAAVVLEASLGTLFRHFFGLRGQCQGKHFNLKLCVCKPWPEIRLSPGLNGSRMLGAQRMCL